MEWQLWFTARLGWTEKDHDKELSAGWPIVGLNFKTCQGTEHAWCGMSLATALHSTGYRIPSSAAGAHSWDGYGIPVDWKNKGIPAGAVVLIRHASGGYHVTTAYNYCAPGQRLLHALGGNQNDSICVSTFDISGNDQGHDQVVHVGWPIKQ